MHYCKGSVSCFGLQLGSLQVCAGQTAGGEVALHVMRKAYQQDDAEGALLIDASNAFSGTTNLLPSL